MKKIYLLLILISLCLPGFAQTTTYSTAGSYVYTVPAAITQVTFTVYGAGGGSFSSAGGKGGEVAGTLAVTPGELLYAFVGAAGGNNNGGAGGNTAGGGEKGGSGGGSDGGAGGGEGSDIRTSISGGATGTTSLASRVVVGGAGGGASFDCAYHAGAAGGYPSGATGVGSCGYTQATGGTQTGVGSGGTYCCGYLGSAGSGGNGGAGTFYGGGGGGGYYGGGGGAVGSGGGGSSYYNSSVVSAVTTTNGTETGVGKITITPVCPSVSITGGGNVAICPAATATVTPSASGGTWSSSNASIASVGSASGIVTGGSTAGTATITYTSSCGSTATTSITVNAAPAAITGNTAPINECATETLADATGSGTWSSNAPAVGSVSGAVVTGVSGGNATVSYTLADGCASTTVITVNGIPAISGSVTSMCSGSTTTLSDSWPGGGTWSSSNTAAGTVNSSGVVTGLPSGTGSPAATTIIYTITGGCNVTYPMTINTQPAAITGASAICGGTVPTSVTLGEVTSGGAWSSSTPASGTVSSSGVVTGIASGSTTISYIEPGGCFSTATVTVNATANISGLPSACVGSTITLTDATGSGTWSSSSPTIGTVSSSGAVTGIAVGSTRISYTVTSTGCSAITTVNVTNPPSTYTMTGGGSYCAGGTGVSIGLNGADALVTYYLFNGSTLVTTVTPTVSGAFSFGTFTTSGTYTAVANYGNPCFANQNGSATITVNSLPTAYSVSGGGAYCSGGSGVNVTLSSSQIGVNYQLMLGGTPIGSALVGTSSSLSFGPVTTAGTYTIIATNASTGCSNTMSGSAVVSISALPTAFAVTGGGGYCLGASGVHVGLANSTTGVTYQLQVGGAPVGTPVSGTTGSSIDFGLQTTSGTYTVLATVTATGCQAAMSGSAVVTINPLPTSYTVTGGGPYCFGGSGSIVGLNGSAIGVNYQLYNGTTPVGSPVAGTGGAISFGSQTGTGSYTVVATNATTGCSNNMTGSVAITTNPLPSVFTITGGGGYCAGGSGVAVGLSGSTAGTTYSLYNGTSLVGAAPGTGSAISFGIYSTPGTYTVTALNTSTLCTDNMSGSVVVSINPVPAVFTVGEVGSGSYCAGSAGVTVTLSGSNTGINYQLYNGTTAIGSPTPGTGSGLTFGPETGAGSYTIVATNATTTCTNNMSGSALVNINPLPTSYAVTGGGGYCSGGFGSAIGLAASNTGISYQLYNGVSTAGPAVAGTGAAINFGTFTAVGTYTVTATNTSTGCATGMSGSAVIVINPLPTAYPFSGSGAYCSGGTGVTTLTLGNSASGVNYQLYNGLTAMGSPVAGTGSSINFPPQTAAGTYTVIGTNATTGCNNTMSGTATVTVNPLPGTFAITGGGAYCAGGTGLNIGLGGSALGINYQLMNGSATVGSPVPGSGSSITFGPQTAAGTYTVVAANGTTGCTNPMTGSTTITINPLPATNTITGGGSYCSGGAGLHVGLNGSVIGVSYQLYNGTTPVGAPMVGTGLALDFGAQTTAGTYSVVGTSLTTGCAANMLGTTGITVNPLPTAYAVTGGGNYCVGTGGVTIGVINSATGVNYQLYRGTTAVGSTIPGNTGSAITFPAQTATGIYTVVGTNTATSCSGNMTGSATVGTYPLPIVYNVTGGGNFCSGGTGVNIGISGSSVGVTYELWDGSLSVTSIPGTGTALNFGPQAIAGTYTVTATNNTTGCSGNMNGSATVNVVALPNLYTVTGGGNYCAGGTGVAVGLSGSDMGVDYQLINGVPVGGTVAGTGSTLNFGNETLAGTYTVMAVSPGTTCTNTMTGSVTVGINPLPNAYPVSGGGSYCAGMGGVDISMTTTDAGVNYQLYNGITAVGSPISGSGSIDFGPQTAAGIYTVVGTNTGTGCPGDMSNTVTVSINPLPTAYTVTGGGSYCAGGAGVHVTTTNSNTGISYQLMVGGVGTGPSVAGTGRALDFGAQTTGGTYTVKATNNVTGCTNMLTGSVNVVVNPLPTLYSVSSTSSTYCAGGAGVDIALTGSDAGISYQLYNGSTTVGTALAGSGTSIDFGRQLAAGSYRVVGVNNTTGCVDTMSSGVTVVIDPLPTVYSVTGGGGYCAGGAGTHIGLSGSNSGISYQLWVGGVSVATASGTGGAIDFGPQTSAGTYTVIANNPATTCTNNMSGSATVVINPLPSVYTLSGGGAYCAGTSGTDVQLSNSTTGVDYQLFAGTSMVGGPVAGSGTTLDFGNQTTTGAYTAVATNTITGCSSAMVGAVTVVMNAAPTPYAVTGGGNYCPGGSGVSVGLANSAAGISYALYNGGTPTGIVLSGSGGPLDFGLQTAAGTYTVVGTNVTTACTGNMSGSANVVINTLPAVYSVMGGGNYCSGGAGVHVGLSNSSSGVNYKLINGFGTLSTLPGTGSPLDFGLQTLAGTYTVQAVNATTGCMANMSGSAAIVVDSLVTPSVSITSNHGDTLCQSTFTTFTATGINAGSTPAYQWTVNGVAAAVGSSYSYIPSNDDVVGVTLTSSAACATPTTANSSLTMAVDPTETPAVNVTSTPGTDVCQGTSVTFMADPVSGSGTAPVYAWYVNGTFEVNAPSYSYMPANNDKVFCVMTSNYRCATSNIATSSNVTMQVQAPALPIVTITAFPSNTVSPGETVTLTANVENGGSSPTYQWLKDGTAIPGANASTYESSNFNNGDSVTCQVTSSGPCTPQVGFNSIYIHVIGTGVAQVTASGSDIKLLPNPNKGVFTIKGSLGSAGTIADESVSLEVTDMLGQVVYKGTAVAHNGEISQQVDLGAVANGMYLLTISSNEGKEVFHVVVEQ